MFSPIVALLGLSLGLSAAFPSQQTDKGKNWVVIVAGSNGWYNYRHQADACHAYQIVHKNGIPDEQIVVMMYDDLANNEEYLAHIDPNNRVVALLNFIQGSVKLAIWKTRKNKVQGLGSVDPLSMARAARINIERAYYNLVGDIGGLYSNPTPGIIINRPNGTDVYKGVPKDYTGDAVTPENFLAVLKGDSQSVKGGSGKVLNSGPNDHVFVYFTDHGAPGILAFPNDDLHVKDFMDTINYMHENKKYKKMVFYIEACESGSMMTRLPADVDVYATTAANAHESSYACYYDEARDTYLGDVYSIKWMEDSDVEDLTKETLIKQFKIVKTETNTSHVQQFGNKTLAHMKVMAFQGNSMAGAQPAEPMTLQPVVNPDIIPSPDVPLAILKRKMMASNDINTVRGLLMEINTHLKVREVLAETMHRVVARVTGDNLKAQKLLNDRLELSQDECYKSAVTYYKHNCFNWHKMEYEYALRHLYALVNLCEGGYSIDSIQKAMDFVCYFSK